MKCMKVSRNMIVQVLREDYYSTVTWVGSGPRAAYPSTRSEVSTVDIHATFESPNRDLRDRLIQF